MFRKVLAIDRVGHSFEVINDFISIITTDGNCLIYKNHNKGNYTNIEGMFSGLCFYSGNELFLNEGFTSRVIDINSYNSLKISCKVEIVKGNRIIASEKEERQRYLISRLMNQSTEWKIPLKKGKHILLEQNILVNSKYLDDGVLYGYDLYNGLLIWTFEISRLGKWIDYDGTEKKIQVEKLLGSYKGKVYLYLNSGKILLLDIESGKKICVLENDKDSNYNTFGNSIELDVENNSLVQLAKQDLIEIDLTSSEVSQTPIEAMKSSTLENYSYIPFDSDNIYFTDKNNQTLGALNRKTHKLDWIHKLSQEGQSQSVQPRYGRILKFKNG